MAEGKTLPLKDSQTMTATISLTGDTLALETNGVAVELAMVQDDDTQNWIWDSIEGVISISSDDYAEVIDCEINGLPRLISKGRNTSQEGVPIEYTYILMVEQLDDSGTNMFGSLTWVGGGMELTRAVRLTSGG